jgi:hypothetical protein
MAGRNFHFCTASTAARSRPIGIPFSTCALTTLPWASMIASMMTTPWSRALRAISV